MTRIITRGPAVRWVEQVAAATVIRRNLEWLRDEERRANRAVRRSGRGSTAQDMRWRQENTLRAGQATARREITQAVYAANTPLWVRILAWGGPIRWWVSVVLSGLLIGGLAGWVTALTLMAIQGR